jgi:hypothetical protein
MTTKSNWLPFMTNDALCKILGELKVAADAAKVKADISFSRNVIDPFTALFQMRLLSIPSADWPIIEKRRQIEKSLQNHIGNFHQKLLGTLTGWNDMTVGSVVDLVSEEKRIIAEVKNKHNTLKASDQSGLYEKLSGLIRKKGQRYYGFTAYYVEIIPKHPERYNEVFNPSDNTTGSKKPEDPLIRKIDGASFYALATGYEDALRQVYEAIPKALAKMGLTHMNTEDKAMLSSYFTDAFGSI